MVKPSNDSRPAGPVRRAVRTIARHTNVRAAERTRQRILAEELDTPPDAEQRAELVRAVLPTPGPACLTRLGAALGFAGAVVVTAAAVFLGVLDAGLDAVHGPAPSTAVAASATCAEPASWCGGASR